MNHLLLCLLTLLAAPAPAAFTPFAASSAWDAENRLVEQTATASSVAAGARNLKLTFAYDYAGRRINKTVSKWDGSGWMADYWKRRAATHGAGEFSEEDLSRMRAGLPPLENNRQGASANICSPNATGAEKPMITVIDSLEDAGRYAGQRGYNVLNIPDVVYNSMSSQEFDRLNAGWLNAAVRRGDTIAMVTNPAAHVARLESIQPGLSQSSRFLNLELPMLQEYGILPKPLKIAP